MHVATWASGRRAARSAERALVSRALDNRLGAYVALEAARRVAEAGGAPVDVVAVAAVQEEIGCYGARTAAFSLDPDVAIASTSPRRPTSPAAIRERPAGRARRRRGDRARTDAQHARRRPARARPPRRRGSRTPSRSTRARRTTDADEVLAVARRGADRSRLGPAAYMHCPSSLRRSHDVEAVMRADRRVRAAARRRETTSSR